MKKILLITFLVIVLSSFTYADLTTGLNLCLSFDNSTVSGTTVLDSSLTKNNATKDSATEPAQTGLGKIFDAGDYDGSDSVETLNDFLTADQNFTIRAWIKPDSTTLGSIVGTIDQVFNKEDFLMRIQTGNIDIFKRTVDSNSDADEVTSTSTIATDRYTHVLFVYNASAGITGGDYNKGAMNLYINGTLEDDTAIDSNNGCSGCGSTTIVIGETANLGSSFFDGKIDEIAFWNRTLNITEILEDYNNNIGVGCSSFEPKIEAPTVILIAPPNNTKTINNLINFTCNISFTDGFLTNVSLFINGTLNQTNTTEVLNNTNFTFQNINLTDGVYLWNCQAFDNNSNSSFADNNFTLTIDKTTPILTDNFINNTVLFRNNLTGQFNFSDNNNLNSVNFTLPLDGNISIFNQTNICAKTFQHNLSYNISSLTIGNHLLRITFADGGTDKKLRGDYKFKKGILNNYIKYEFWDRGYIKTNKQDSSIFDKWTSIKEVDKYTQIYEPSNPKETQVFIEESEQPIFIYTSEDKNHHGGIWIVTGNHWKDYVLKDEPQAKTKIRRIDKYTVEVTISNIINKEKLQFESVGDLNVVTIDYNFSIANVTESFTTPTLNDLETNLFLDFNNVGHPIPTNVILEWNNTNFTATQTINNATLTRYKQNITPSLDLNTTNREANVSHRWFFNLTNIEQTETQNQTIQQISLDNCSDLTTVALNYSIKDEANQSLLDTADVTGTYNYNNGGGSGRTFDLTVTNSNNFSICIFPPQVTLTGNYTLTYSADNYQQRTFIDNSPVITNTTQEINLFLLNDADGIFGIFRTINTLGQTISGTLITMIKVIGGSPQIVETQSTDDSGLATFFVDPDVTYSFVFAKTGFETQTFNLRITTSEIITVTMISTEEALDQPEGIGILFSFTPLNEVPLNNTDTNFTFNLSSSFRDITSCNFTLKNSTTDLANIVGTFNNDICTASISLNTGNQTLITAEAQYSLNITINRTISQDYIVLNTYVGQFSLKNFFDDLGSFGEGGFNDTTRIILALVVIITITSITANKMPIVRDPEPLIILAWALSFIFASIGWLTINSTTMPNIGGFDLQQWFLFILLTVVTLSYIIKREFF